MNIKKIILIIVLVLLAGSIAIASKVMLPSDVNVKDFDSIFVRVLGFEIVASLYFVMIYTHNAIITSVFGRRAKLSNMQIGLRFGICFALIYLFGMQEVVVEAAPYATWGLDFVVYQFFMGAGEAVAALLLCVAISLFIIDKRHAIQPKTPKLLREKASAVLLIAAAFTAVRVIAYETGTIHSNVDSFPIPSYIWTGIFGIVLGFCFIMLYPVFDNQKSPVKLSVNIMVLTVGLCWIFFNLFIGLIFAGTITEMLLRSGLDVLAVFSATFVWSNYIRKK